VRGGFIERSRDSEDGRRARLHLTRQGEQVTQARGGTVESAIVTSLESLTSEERAAVSRWLSAFSEALANERAGLSEG
jgi:DNA-binding MarR family transcriptional regulator